MIPKHCPEDRERFFEVIKSMEGGKDGFNNFVISLIRKWEYESVRSMTIKEADDDIATEKQLLELCKTASLLHQQGKLQEAREMYERTLR